MEGVPHFFKAKSYFLVLRKACKNSRSLENPFWEKSMWKEERRRRRKKEEGRRNNAKFSSHYVRPRTTFAPIFSQSVLDTLEHVSQNVTQ